MQARSHGSVVQRAVAPAAYCDGFASAIARPTGLSVDPILLPRSSTARSPCSQVIHHMNIVLLGLSITASRSNPHATTFQALAGALASRGHHVAFLERA